MVSTFSLLSTENRFEDTNMGLIFSDVGWCRGNDAFRFGFDWLKIIVTCMRVCENVIWCTLYASFYCIRFVHIVYICLAVYNASISRWFIWVNHCALSERESKIGSRRLLPGDWDGEFWRACDELIIVTRFLDFVGWVSLRSYWDTSGFVRLLIPHPTIPKTLDSGRWGTRIKTNGFTELFVSNDVLGATEQWINETDCFIILQYQKDSFSHPREELNFGMKSRLRPFICFESQIWNILSKDRNKSIDLYSESTIVRIADGFVSVQ